MPGSEGPETVLVLVSDTHEQHRMCDVPDGDLFIHAGDFTFFNSSTKLIRDFNQWLTGLPHKNKIIIPGNHDSGFISPEYRALITGATLLLNSGTVACGLKIWGSPVVPGNWGAFGPATDQERKNLFSLIPNDTDVLVTHGPPRGILDLACDSGEPQGCPRLLEAVRRIRPQVHVFGHIHRSYGQVCSAGTIFLNAALAGPGHSLTKQPISISLRVAAE